MTRSFAALGLALVLFSACTPSDAPSATPAGHTAGEGMGGATLADFRTDTDFVDLMAHVIDYSAFEVWNRQGWIIDKDGIHELFPTTDDEWHKAESAAFTLAEAANTLLLPGRPRDDDRRWVDYSHELYTAAKKAQATALSRDLQAFFDAGGEIYQACVACHNHYVQGDKPGADAKLPVLPNRAPPPNQ